MTLLPLLEARLLGQPLAIDGAKLDVILGALSPRLLEGAALAMPGAPMGKPSVIRHGAIAVVPIVGTLANRTHGLNALSGLQSYRDLGSQLEAVAADQSVRGIILELDSPGGEFAGSLDLVDTIRRIRSETKKPLWSVVSENALSAGYLIASAADRVLVTQTGCVGSIGIVMAHVDRSGADAQQGHAWSLLHAGAHKIDGNSHHPLTPEARARLQAMVDASHAQLCEAVARNRRTSSERIRGTQARIFHGADAVKAGLADGVSTLRQAIADMGEKFGQPRPIGTRKAMAAPSRVATGVPVLETPKPAFQERIDAAAIYAKRAAAAA